MRSQEEDDIHELKSAGYKAIAKQYKKMARTLRIIRTWAAYDFEEGFGQVRALSPRDTLDLCDRALERFTNGK